MPEAPSMGHSARAGCFSASQRSPRPETLPRHANHAPGSFLALAPPARTCYTVARTLVQFSTLLSPSSPQTTPPSFPSTQPETDPIMPTPTATSNRVSSPHNGGARQVFAPAAPHQHRPPFTTIPVPAFFRPQPTHFLTSSHPRLTAPSPEGKPGFPRERLAGVRFRLSAPSPTFPRKPRIFPQRSAIKTQKRKETEMPQTTRPYFSSYSPNLPSGTSTVLAAVNAVSSAANLCGPLSDLHGSLPPPTPKRGILTAMIGMAGIGCGTASASGCDRDARTSAQAPFFSPRVPNRLIEPFVRVDCPRRRNVSAARRGPAPTVVFAPCPQGGECDIRLLLQRWISRRLSASRRSESARREHTRSVERRQPASDAHRRAGRILTAEGLRTF